MPVTGGTVGAHSSAAASSTVGFTGVGTASVVSFAGLASAVGDGATVAGVTAVVSTASIGAAVGDGRSVDGTAATSSAGSGGSAGAVGTVCTTADGAAVDGTAGGAFRSTGDSGAAVSSTGPARVVGDGEIDTGDGGAGVLCALLATAGVARLVPRQTHRESAPRRPLHPLALLAPLVIATLLMSTLEAPWVPLATSVLAWPDIHNLALLSGCLC